MLAPPLPEFVPPKRSPAALSPRLPPSADPRIQAFDERWEEFEAADYEARIALFLRTLGEPELMDGEMAFEMLNTLHSETAAHQERHRFEELAEALRLQRPDVYAEEARFIIPCRITNALATGQPDTAAALARELAMIADRAIDPFFQTVDQLAYHGQLQTLLDVIPIAWPRLKEGSDVLPWALDDLGSRAADFLMFDYLERGGSATAVDPELREQVNAYLNVRPEGLDEWLGFLAGQTERPWSMTDFAFKPPSKARRRDEDEEDEFGGDTGEDEGRRNLISLSAQFLGYLRREENVSYTRGEMGREQIVRYLFDRFDGDLVPRPSMAETILGGKKRKAQPPTPPPAHLLCPDRTTLDIYLGQLCNFLNLQYYKTAALFELIPAWLRFLEARGLIDASRREATLNELSGVRDDLLKVWGTADSDPALRQAMEHWNESADPSARNH
jgi:hypothetical protein